MPKACGRAIATTGRIAGCISRCGAAASYDNLVVDDAGHVISGTVNDPGGCCGVAPEGWQGATKRRTNTYQFAVGGSYDAGPLRVSADLAHTASTFKLYTESVDFQLNRRPTSIDWYTGRPGGYGPTFKINGLDFSDPVDLQLPRLL